MVYYESVISGSIEICFMAKINSFMIDKLSFKILVVKFLFIMK